MQEKLSAKVVERLSLYRQSLSRYQYGFEPHIFSADLARVLKTTEENVRRDLMLCGCKSTSKRKGFSVPYLIERISCVLDMQEPKVVNIVIIGQNNCLKDILNNFSYHNLKIVGVFDFIFEKEVETDGITHYPFEKLTSVINEKNVVLAVMNISADYVEHITEILVNSGIKGIINFSPVTLSVPEHIYLEEVNQMTLLEKAIYFIKEKENQSSYTTT